MDPNSTQREFQDLLDRLCAGALTSDERLRLNELLRTCDECCQEYLRYMHVHATLAYGTHDVHLETGSVERPSKTQLEVAPKADRGLVLIGLTQFFTQPTPLSLAVAVLVTGLIITAMAFMAPPFYRALVRSEGTAPSGEYEIVAELTGKHEVTWASPSDSLHRGVFLVRGRALRLDKGMVEVTFRDGAVVMLSGPCEFFVSDRNSGELRLGKLVARVERQKAKGFTVETPAGSIVDLGTEFALTVDENGETDTLVLSGVVELRYSDPSQQTAARRLAAGESLRLTSGGRVDDIPSSRLNSLQQLAQQRRAWSTTGPLLANGSFERTSAAPSAPGERSERDFGWKISADGPGVDIGRGNFLGARIDGAVASSDACSARDGRQFLLFNPGIRGAGGSIVQEVTTEVGAAYRLRYSIASAPKGRSTHELTAAVGSTYGKLASRSDSAPLNRWVDHTLDFVADSNRVKVTFTNSAVVGGIDSDLLLDAVELIRSNAPQSAPDETE